MSSLVVKQEKETKRRKKMTTYLKIFLTFAFLVQGHPFLVLFVVFPFSGLEIEPSVTESLDMGQ